jgi:hypothetical protein
MAVQFDPHNADLTEIDLGWVKCFMKSQEHEHDDVDARINLRIIAIFVILVGSTAVTMLPPWLSRFQGRRGASWFFLGSKFIGAGVLMALAFIQ